MKKQSLLAAFLVLVPGAVPASGEASRPETALGLIASHGASPIPPHVADNARVATLSSLTGRFRRDGFAAAGDGGAADYTTTAAACSLGSGAGDGGSQVALIGPAGTPGIHVGCAIADLDSRGPISVALWGVRADSNGLTGTGTDSTSFMQKAVAWAQASGRALAIPAGTTGTNGPGMVRLTAPLTIGGHVFLTGDYCEHDNGGYTGPQTRGLPSPGPGSYLYFDHTGKGISIGEAGATDGVALTNFCTWRNQPAPPPGSDGNGTGAYWAPNANDYDIYEASDDVRLEHLMLLDPTSGIEVLGGRLTTYDVRGQFLSSFYHGDGPQDVNRLMNTHAAPFWSQNVAVLNYMRAHQTLLYTARNDGFRIEELYAVIGGTCWHVATNSSNATTLGAVADTLSCDDFGLGGITTDGNPTASGVGQMDLHSFAFGGSRGTYTTRDGGSASFQPGPSINDLNGFRINAFGANSAYNFGSSIVANAGAVISIYGVPVFTGINRGNSAKTPVLSADASSKILLFGDMSQIQAPIPSNLDRYGSTGTIQINGVDARTNILAASVSGNAATATTALSATTAAAADNSIAPPITIAPGGTFTYIRATAGALAVLDITTKHSAIFAFAASTDSPAVLQGASEFALGFSPTASQTGFGESGSPVAHFTLVNGFSTTHTYAITPIITQH